MDKNFLRERVRNLRSKGHTYSEILSELKLKLPKSTMSDWCQDVVMPAGYQAKVDELNKTNFSKAQKMSWASLRLKREKLLSSIAEKNKNLSEKLGDKDLLRMFLSGLYLGEGSKWKSHSGLQLGSSDPSIILLYIRLLEICYDIPKDKFKCRISYRADQDIRALEHYWSEVTGIPLSNFYKTISDPRTIGKPTKKLDYKGVCVIMCGNSSIQLELESIPSIILKGL